MQEKLITVITVLEKNDVNQEKKTILLILRYYTQHKLVISGILGNIMRSVYTLVRAMNERTATAVNIMVGISITTAEPILVLKKVMVASQPL